jgi:hypothetical protein
MKIYTPPKPLEPELPTLPQTLTHFAHAEYGLTHWIAKIKEKLSSPSQGPFDSWARGIERLLASGELTIL